MIVLVWSMKTFSVHIKWNIYDRPPSTIIHLSRHLTAKSNLSKWNFLKTKLLSQITTKTTNHRPCYVLILTEYAATRKRIIKPQTPMIWIKFLITRYLPTKKQAFLTPLSLFTSRKLDPFNPISAAFVFLLIFLFTASSVSSFKWKIIKNIVFYIFSHKNWSQHIIQSILFDSQKFTFISRFVCFDTIFFRLACDLTSDANCCFHTAEWNFTNHTNSGTAIPTIINKLCSV